MQSLGLSQEFLAFLANQAFKDEASAKDEQVQQHKSIAGYICFALSGLLWTVPLRFLLPRVEVHALR